MGVPKAVLKRAARNGGYVTRAQLVEAGLSDSAIDRRVSSGELIVVSKGTYQLLPSTDHIDLMLGAVLALPDAVASHQSAAHLLDLPRLPFLVPTVTVPSHTTHRFAGVVVRRADDLVRRHLTTVDRVPVTDVFRTLFDLAGLLDFREFDQMAEAAIVEGRMELRHFDRITGELARRGKRGSRAARDFLTMRLGTDPRSTALERKGRSALTASGLPLPIPQYPIPWSPDRRFDDAYPDARLAIEWDSRRWHQQRAAMASDRQRDREAAIHGWYVIRFTWDDVAEPAEVGAAIASLLQSRREVSSGGVSSLG